MSSQLQTRVHEVIDEQRDFRSWPIPTKSCVRSHVGC